MIKSNRVIQTTIFVVFLFVVLSLPILNKTGVIFVQIAKADGYAQCTTDNFKNPSLFLEENLLQMCEIFNRAQLGNFGLFDYNGDRIIKCETSDLNAIKRNLLILIPELNCPSAAGKGGPYYTKVQAFNKDHPGMFKSVCLFCQDPNPTKNSLASTAGIAEPTGPSIIPEVPKPGGIPGENLPGWEPTSTEEGYCLLRDKNGVLLNKDSSPCALASTWGWLNPLNSITGGIFYIVYLMLRGVLVVILKVFQWLLNPLNFGGYINFLNFNPGPSNPSLVPQLWSFIKNFANLGIILGMIFTAIATILRIEKYNWKKMLPKLLLIALLVNFSLIIAGMFVDISNYIVNVTVTSFNNISLSNLVVNCSLCPTVKAFYGLGGEWDLARATGLGIILSALFFYQFIGLVFYVFIRILTIVICLITSPLAFLSFAFPGGEKVWDFWRKQFQQAIVILPVLCIVFVLSLQFINIIVSNLNNNIKPGDEGAFIIVLAYAGFVLVFAQLVRYVAKFLGVEQVEKGFQIAKKAVNTIAMAGVAAVGGIAIPKIMESKAFQKVGEGLTHVPLLSGVGQQMMMKGEKNKADRITKYQKEYENLSLGQLKALEKTPLPSPLDRPGYERRIGLANQLAKIGELGDESIKFIKLHQHDRNFDQLTISRAVPQDFRIKDGVFGETGPTVKDKVQALAGIKENKILELTQAKEFIKDQVDEAEKRAKEAGKSKDEIERIKIEKFNEVIQEIVRTLNPAQLNAFWRAISAKTLVEEGWGGPKGKIMEAIDQLDDTRKKFHEEMLPLSRALQEISGVKPPKENESA